MGKKLISACLYGINCKYNGLNNYNQRLLQCLQNDQVCLFCPEMLGGLPVPRPPSEIVDGDGLDVLEGRSRVLSSTGEDVTPGFIQGARAALEEAMRQRPELIILKSRSPSCGIGLIYDGSFSSRLRRGNGVAAEMLKKAGYKLISDEEYLSRGGF